MNREKEQQKRKLQEAISLHQHTGIMGVGPNKKVQEKIINNFRSFHTNSSYLHQPSQFASMPPSMNQPPPSHPSIHPYYYCTQGVNGSTEDHTTIDLTTHQPSNKVEMIPNFLSVLHSSLDDDSDEQREKKKSKLMKVCVDHTRSTLKKNCGNVNLTNDSSSSSTASINGPESESEDWKKMPADVSKKSSTDMKSAGTQKHKEGTNYSSSGSESLL